MKKVRVNLKEKYPHYFAATESTDEFAEVSDQDVSRLDKLEAALTPTAQAEEVPAPVVEEVETPVAAVTPPETEEVKEDPKYAALESKIANLEKLISTNAATASTVIDTDNGQEGTTDEQVKTYATSVDAEMEKLFKK